MLVNVILQNKPAHLMPLAFIKIGMRYACEAIDLAAKDKVKMLNGVSKEARNLINVINTDAFYKGTPMEMHCIPMYHHLDDMENYVKNDLVIMSYSVRGEFRRVMPNFPYEEMRCLAIMASVILREAEWEVSEMPATDFYYVRDRFIFISKMLRKLIYCMDAFAGTTKKFNYKNKNIVDSVNVLKNKILRMI